MKLKTKPEDPAPSLWFFDTYLHLLFLCVEHVGVDAQRSQHAHHQLLLPQPRTQLTRCRGEAAQPVGARLQLSLSLGCGLIG